MRPILQTRMPLDPEDASALPGVAPLDPAQWLLRDDAFGAQMARRDDLLATRRGDVLRLTEPAVPPALELLDTVLEHLDDGYQHLKGAVIRPDGVHVALDRDDPLATLGRLVQEDFCLMQKQGAEHVLTGAVLCFPASWTVAEKMAMPLTRIHRPVTPYDHGIARRVQRLFDGVRVGHPLWRFNCLRYADPALFQPRRENDPRDPEPVNQPAPRYIRSERQTLWRLASTGAVAFGIHTFVMDAKKSDTAETVSD